LKDVHIEETHHQKPQNMLELERFSYFYKDPLSGLYNETSLLKDIHILQNYKHIVWLSLKGFHNYNKVHGWDRGDELLIDIANILKKTLSKESMLYRFYGDNFLIFNNSADEIKQMRKALEKLLQDKEISIDIRVNTTEMTKDLYIESLRDVLEKLF
ncbi:MAG: diguanylate cyclase, partial [Epsilonproteobacteria bacterium]|nr:diguanylate cyclase [Campylobacterota bacterium]